MNSPLSAFIGQQLIWVPTAPFKDCYDLVTAEGQVLATLDRSSWTSKANAGIPEGMLFLHGEGWTGQKVNILPGEQGPILATFQLKWTGTRGWLFMANGRQYQWKNINFWGTRKMWSDPSESVVYIQFSTAIFSRKVTIDLFPQAAEVPEISLLLVLGLYNIIVEMRTAAAIAAVVVVIAAAAR